MLRQIATAACLLVAASLAYAGEAARIVFVAGDVHVASHVTALGDPVNEGDEIATGADGYVYMKTVDNGFLILRPNSRAHISAYHVDQQNPANSHFKLELLSGVARSISGLGVKQAKQNFRFNTPVAAIGVRGTDFTVFTDQDVSRVTVISGGVVVSGFGETCRPDGGGPCEGAATRELFADHADQLLQVQKGQLMPQLLHSKGISPDSVVPPRGDEPSTISKTSSIGNAGLAPVDLSLDPQKSADLAAVGTALPVTTVVTPPITPPIIVVPPVTPVPPVVVPTVPEIIWGRWTAIANLPADPSILAKVNTSGVNGYGIGYSNNWFVITRVNDTQLVLPSSGQASFSLQNSEAYIIANGQSPVAATMQNALLSVNFGQSTFATSFNLVAPGEQGSYYAQGSVVNRGTNSGALISNVLTSNIDVRGYLGGANAQQAGYIFNSLNSPAVYGFGATSWSR